MVRDRSAKPLCSGSIPLDSFRSAARQAFFLSRGAGGLIYINKRDLKFFSESGGKTLYSF